MELKCITLFLIIAAQALGLPGDPVMYLPPFEVRAMDSNNKPIVFPFPNAQFQPMSQQLMPSQSLIQHTTPVPTEESPATTAPLEKHKNHNFTFNEFVEALDEMSEQKDRHVTHDQSRAAARDYEYPAYPAPPAYPSAYPSYPPMPSYPRPVNYGYSRPPSYGPWSSAPPPAAYVPPTTVHHTTPKTLKPELTSLLKPVTTKVASKVSGLIGLVLTLLTGSAPDDLELNGFKDIVINGIVKPLLIAKGGIKSLISKLTIPVISLLLINLEVLITIWWLWEECPEPTPVAAPVYPYPKPPYSSY